MSYTDDPLDANYQYRWGDIVANACEATLVTAPYWIIQIGDLQLTSFRAPGRFHRWMLKHFFGIRFTYYDPTQKV